MPTEYNIKKIQLPNGDICNLPEGLIVLNYGTSTWQEFIDAYNTNSIVYCKASSGSGYRLAFMAYINSTSNPTEVEFQYYRSVSTHSDSQQGDEVYVYKLTSSNVWTTTTRKTYTKIDVGTGLSKAYSNGVLTLTNIGGSSAQIINIDMIAYDVNNSKYCWQIALINGFLAFNIIDSLIYEYDENNQQWNTSSITLNDGSVIHSQLEDAYYLFNGMTGILNPISYGKSICEVVEDSSDFWFRISVPECNSNSVLIVDSYNSTQNNYYMNLYTIANDLSPNIITSFGTYHNIIIRNNKSTDLSVTMTDNEWQDGGSCSGVISSGMDLNNGFTIKANDFVEISIYMSDFMNYGSENVPIIIVKDGYQSNITKTPI